MVNAWIVGMAMAAMAPADGLSAGARVMARSSSMTLRVGNQVVASEHLHHVYRIERVEKGWLWIVSGNLRGWVRAEEVVPFDGAIDHFSREIARDPRSAGAYLSRGIVWYDRAEYDRAIADNSEAIRINRKDAVAYHNRGNALLAKKEYARAVADYNEATRIDPRDAASYHNRARAREARNDQDLAIADENEAIRLDPNDVEKYHLRARSWSAIGAYDQALADYARSLAIDPKDVTAHTGRAWIWATCPEANERSGRKAVESATTACTLSAWRDPFAIGTLAASLAESGDFGAAVDWQTKALELFRQSGREQPGDRLRLDLYRARKPYRETPTAP